MNSAQRVIETVNASQGESEPSAEHLVVSLCESADDSGCSDDLIVVSKSTLCRLAQRVLEDVPRWLTDKAR